MMVRVGIGQSPIKVRDDTSLGSDRDENRLGAVIIKARFLHVIHEKL